MYRLLKDKVFYWQYYVCEFEGGEFGAVPVNWLFRDDQKVLHCRWTSAREHVIQAHGPNPNWPIYRIVKLYGKKKGTVFFLVKLQIGKARLLIKYPDSVHTLNVDTYQINI